VKRSGAEEAGCWELHDEAVTLRGRDEPTRLATPLSAVPANIRS
jgi:hypothetical protein